LQIFNENEPIKKKNEKEKSIGSLINNKNKINKNTFNAGKKENNDMNQNAKNKSRPKTGLKRKKIVNFSKIIIILITILLKIIVSKIMIIKDQIIIQII
jgi:hypothetical protein